MDKKAVQLHRATPVLKVADYPIARTYYVDILGFQVTEEGGDPPRFGIIQREQCILFLNAWQGAQTPLEGGWEAYVHVSNLQDLFKEYETAGANITRTITKTTYGMNEFEVTDPDGNRLCFGEDTDPPIIS